MDSQTLSVVIPVYNEAASIVEVVKLVLAQPVVTEVVIVDDASTDGTWPQLQEVLSLDPRVRLFRHEKNRGKGAALRTGFKQATQALILVQDADFEYSPAEYPRLLEPLFSGRADVVLGSRFMGADACRVLYFWHSLANKFITLLSNVTTNLNLSDVEACYKVFRREILEELVLCENRFGFEPEVVAKVARTRARIYEVPISYHGRTYAEGKKIGWKDGLSAVRCIFRYGFFP